jgi:hypothetical protein
MRTGFLVGHVQIDPPSRAAVRKRRGVRIGYGKSAFYGAALTRRGWKGLWDTATSMQDRLRAIIGEQPLINDALR